MTEDEVVQTFQTGSNSGMFYLSYPTINCILRCNKFVRKSSNFAICIVIFIRFVVPEYEVVRVFHSIQKRDIDEEDKDRTNATVRVKINAFRHKMSLYLTPAEGLLAGYFTPVWKVEPDSASPDGTKYTRILRVIIYIKKIYLCNIIHIEKKIFKF